MNMLTELCNCHPHCSDAACLISPIKKLSEINYKSRRRAYGRLPTVHITAITKLRGRNQYECDHCRVLKPARWLKQASATSENFKTAWHKIAWH